MKVVIISDVHNNLVRLKKVLDFCQKEKVAGIISCGDLASKETLTFLKTNFIGSVWHVLGNMDKDFLKEKLTKIIKEENSIIFPDYGEVFLNGKRAAFTHFPQRAQELFSLEKYQVVFYGHTHCPWLSRKKDTYLINPGNVAGERFKATFALWEVEKNLFHLLSVD